MCCKRLSLEIGWVGGEGGFRNSSPYPWLLNPVGTQLACARASPLHSSIEILSRDQRSESVESPSSPKPSSPLSRPKSDPQPSSSLSRSKSDPSEPSSSSSSPELEVSLSLWSMAKGDGFGGGFSPYVVTCVRRRQGTRRSLLPKRTVSPNTRS